MERSETLGSENPHGQAPRGAQENEFMKLIDALHRKGTMTWAGEVSPKTAKSTVLGLVVRFFPLDLDSKQLRA